MDAVVGVWGGGTDRGVERLRAGKEGQHRVRRAPGVVVAGRDGVLLRHQVCKASKHRQAGRQGASQLASSASLAGCAMVVDDYDDAPRGQRVLMCSGSR